MGKFNFEEHRSSGRGKSRGRSSGRFSDRGSGRGGSRGRDSRSRSDKPSMHKVTCEKCGKDCEVPFRPTTNKPVYCSDCFRKGPSSKSKDFEEINRKLDLIMESMGLN